MAQQPIQIAGMSWYLAEDFAAIKALMHDGDKLHRTHAEWQVAAENGERSLRAKGGVVYRAIVRPNEFRAWCLGKGLDPDAKARNQFAAEFANHEYRAGR